MIEREHIEHLLQRVQQLEAELATPGVAANHRRFRELLSEHAALKEVEGRAREYLKLLKELSGNRELLASPGIDEEMRELASLEIDAIEERLPALERELMIAMLPPDPDAARGVIAEIRAGTGGDEAALFAGDLYRMYSRYASDRGWKATVIDASPSEQGGYKEIIFSIEGTGVYSELRYESGVHRVQRVPETEASGRIHTSAATVAVFPEAVENDDIEIKPEELRVDIFCSSGPGGQGVNTTYSAVRITHLPTGIVAQSQDERSQHRNKEKAMSVIKARLLDATRMKEEEKKGSSRRSMIGSGDRSERIRTYNFPQNRVTDHRVNLTLYSLDRVIDGELGELTAALSGHDIDLRLKAHAGEVKR